MCVLCAHDPEHGTLQASVRSEEEKAARQEAELTQLRDQLYRAHQKTSRSSLDNVQPSLSRTLRSRQQVSIGPWQASKHC